MSTSSVSLRTRRRRSASRRAAVVSEGRPTPAGGAVVSIAPAPALAVAGLCRDRGDRRVLEDFHLEVARGERVAVVGAPGAGKSTLLAALRGGAPAVTIDGHLRLADDADGGSFDAPGSEGPDRPAVVLEVHELERALAGADRIVVLGQGRVLHQLHLGSGPRDLAGPAWVAVRDRLAAAVGEPAARLA